MHGALVDGTYQGYNISNFNDLIGSGQEDSTYNTFCNHIRYFHNFFVFRYSCCLVRDISRCIHSSLCSDSAWHTDCWVHDPTNCSTLANCTTAHHDTNLHREDCRYDCHSGVGKLNVYATIDNLHYRLTFDQGNE